MRGGAGSGGPQISWTPLDWLACLARAARIDRMAKGREQGNPWLEAERLIAAIAEPRAAAAVGSGPGAVTPRPGPTRPAGAALGRMVKNGQYGKTNGQYGQTSGHTNDQIIHLIDHLCDHKSHK